MKHKCPNCKEPADYSAKNPFRPFCSERCKLIDLGDWLTGNNSIAGDDSADFVESSQEIVKH